MAIVKNIEVIMTYTTEILDDWRTTVSPTDVEEVESLLDGHYKKSGVRFVIQAGRVRIDSNWGLVDEYVAYSVTAVAEMPNHNTTDEYTNIAHQLCFHEKCIFSAVAYIKSFMLGWDLGNMSQGSNVGTI